MVYILRKLLHIYDPSDNTWPNLTRNAKASFIRQGQSSHCNRRREDMLQFLLLPFQKLKEAIKTRLLNSSLPPPLPDSPHYGPLLDSLLQSPQLRFQSYIHPDLISHQTWTSSSHNHQFMQLRLLSAYYSPSQTFSSRHFCAKFIIPLVMPFKKKQALIKVILLTHINSQ